MDCILVRRELSDYIDGELPEDERQAIEAHLAACEACRAACALLQDVDDAMATWPVLAEPQGLAARVMQEIRASESRTMPHVRAQLWEYLRPRWQDTLLALALALTVAVLFLSARYTWAAGVVEVRALDLQVQQSLSLLERAWYAARADVGHFRGEVGRIFGWVSGALVLAAAAVAAIVLAVQWPGEIVMPFRHHRSKRI
jgi:anti-sigma factor RsiW